MTVQELYEAMEGDYGAALKVMMMEPLVGRMIVKLPQDPSFEKLMQAGETLDAKGIFEAAHALKGVLSNLSLTPICEPVEEITELLRNRTEMDYSELLQTILEQKAALDALCE